MYISLLELARKYPATQQADLMITERLPFYIEAAPKICCYYQAKDMEDYILLTIQMESTLCIQCQRCLQAFSYPYECTTVLAVCREDKTAERLMTDYECMVSEQDKIDLTAIVTDDLYLSVPEKHSADECVAFKDKS